MAEDDVGAINLPGTVKLDLEIVHIGAITPRVRRITLSGDLQGFDPLPGQDVMVLVSDGDKRPTRRRYTVSRFNRVHHLVAIDVIMHKGAAPGVTWANQVRPGDKAALIGPRGKVLLSSEADGHVFIGDDSFQPATFAMLGALSANQRGYVLLEVESPLEEQVPATGPERLEMNWLHREGGLPGGCDALIEALKSIELPTGRAQAYVGGESQVVKQVRDLLIGNGWDAQRIADKAYWSQRQANGPHGEPERLEP